jgi:hypothetical protein
MRKQNPYEQAGQLKQMGGIYVAPSFGKAIYLNTGGKN